MRWEEVEGGGGLERGGARRGEEVGVASEEGNCLSEFRWSLFEIDA